MTETRSFRDTVLFKILNVGVYLFAGLFLFAIFLVLLVGYEGDVNDPAPILKRHFQLSEKQVSDLQGSGASWLEYKANLYFKADEFKPLINMVVYEKVDCVNIAESIKFNHPDFARAYGLDKVVLSGNDDISAYSGVMGQERFTCYAPTTDKIKSSYLLYDQVTGGHYFYIMT